MGLLMLLYLLVAVTVLAGWTGAPWWAAVAGACMMALVLFQEEMRTEPPPGDEATWELAETITNVLIGSATAALAFVCGRLSTFVI